jgi:hypothetical protein
MEQRSVVRFFTLEKLLVKDMRAELECVYGHEALSCSGVTEWGKRFANGRIHLEDGPRPGIAPKATPVNQREPLLRKILLLHATAYVRSFAS